MELTRVKVVLELTRVKVVHGWRRCRPWRFLGGLKVSLKDGKVIVPSTFSADE